VFDELVTSVVTSHTAVDSNSLPEIVVHITVNLNS